MVNPNEDANAIPVKYRNPVIHDRGPSAYPRDYQVTDAALKAYGIPRELFGTTEVRNADGSSFRVKDYQYLLEDGSVGMTFLPVNDDGAAAGPDGEMVYGSVLVDQLLRSKMGLKAEDPIYALMYFIHPELNKVPFWTSPRRTRSNSASPIWAPTWVVAEPAIRLRSITTADGE
jgi:hypothetical protein